MCAFGGKQKPIKNITPAPTALPDEPPAPVEVKRNNEGGRKTNVRNPLRIELAQQRAGSANTGVNV